MGLLESVGILGASSVVLMTLAIGCGSEATQPSYDNINTTGATPSTGGGAVTTGGGVGTTGGATNAAGAVTTGDSFGGTTGGATAGGATVAGATVGGATTGGAQTTSGAATTGAGTTGFGMNNATTTGGDTTGGATTGAGTTGGPNICNPSLTGEQFFMQPLSCVRCHGPQGQGIEDLGPEIQFTSEDYARWIIREGRDDHPDFPDGMEATGADCLTDAQLDQIIDFLNGQPRPTDGAGLFAAFCANCHGPNGGGGVTGVSLDGELHELATIAPVGAHTDEFDNRTEFMPVMTELLSQQELDLILNYLQNDLGLAF